MPARIVPVLGQHVEATTTVLQDVVDVTGQASRTAGMAAQDDLAVRGGQVGLQEVAALEQPFRRLTRLLREIRVDVADRLGDPLLPQLERRLRRLGEQATRAEREASLTADAAAFVPTALGRDGPRRYLVLFTSPAEARGRFGFPGSFAEVLFEDGRYRLGEHGTTSATFPSGSLEVTSFPSTDDRVQPYLSYGVTNLLSSVTIPPDFRTVARLAAEGWAETGRAPVDGVMRFDPASLAALLQQTGPVQVAGVDALLTSENLEQFLLVDQYVQFPDEQAPRREVLDTVAEVTFERLETADLPPPSGLVDLFAPLVREGHLQIVTFDPDGADLFDRSALSGGFDAPRSDSLVVTTVNSGGNKIDTFLSTSVTYDADVADGHLRGTVWVDLTNAAPAGGLPFYVIGSSTAPSAAPGHQPPVPPRLHHGPGHGAHGRRHPHPVPERGDGGPVGPPAPGRPPPGCLEVDPAPGGGGAARGALPAGPRPRRRGPAGPLPGRGAQKGRSGDVQWSRD